MCLLPKKNPPAPKKIPKNYFFSISIFLKTKKNDLENFKNNLPPPQKKSPGPKKCQPNSYLTQLELINWSIGGRGDFFFGGGGNFFSNFLSPFFFFLTKFKFKKNNFFKFFFFLGKLKLWKNNFFWRGDFFLGGGF